MVIGLRWLLHVTCYILLLPLSYPAAILVPLFTRADYSIRERYRWGGLFGTYDNPPQGDRGWQSKRSPYPGITTGWKGYINRVGWMLRNKLYGYKRKTGIMHDGRLHISIKGDPDISDKHQRAGWMHASARDKKGRMVAFEWYSVMPYSSTRCVRIRLGWKIKGRKFTTAGDFAPLVFTFNPLDGYGDE